MIYERDGNKNGRQENFNYHESITLLYYLIESNVKETSYRMEYNQKEKLMNQTGS